MPVPSPSGSVRRWPAAAEVLEQAGRWAALQRSDHPDLMAVDVFGSYGRGTAGVGSDLELLLILQRCDESIWRWLRRWDTSSLPLACDLLVYSHEEWRSLPQWNPKLAQALLNDTRWLGEMPESAERSRRLPRFSRQPRRVLKSPRDGPPWRRAPAGDQSVDQSSPAG